MWETKRVTILPPTAWHRKLERWLGLSSKWSQPATAYQPHSPSPLSSSVKWSRKWVPLHRSLRRSNKRMLTGADTQCAHKCCLLSVFGIACFIETSQPLSSGLFYSSLNLPLCSDLSSTQYFFSYSIFCHWLHSFPNHTKLSSCFRRLWEIQILLQILH